MHIEHGQSRSRAKKMKSQTTTAPAPEEAKAEINTQNFTSEALDGLERSIREPHSTRLSPAASDDSAVEAGLAYRAERGIQPTTLGILVFDELAKAKGYAFRSTPEYQKRLTNALKEAVGMTSENSAGIGITEEGRCACPMCGADQPASILRGETLSWWIYQINNLRRPRLDADVERTSDLEYAVTRR
jgi:hypothetical protein